MYKRQVDAYDPVRLMLFPEMEPERDVPEITTACWGILHKSPDDVMCAGARMVVKRRDAPHPVVLACTLLAYDPRFEMGTTLKEASVPEMCIRDRSDGCTPSRSPLRTSQCANAPPPRA